MHAAGKVNPFPVRSALWSPCGSVFMYIYITTGTEKLGRMLLWASGRVGFGGREMGGLLFPLLIFCIVWFSQII